MSFIPLTARRFMRRAPLMVGGTGWVNPFRADTGISRHKATPDLVLQPCLRMRVAAVDLGKVRVGLAVSDEAGRLPHPRPALAGGNQKRLPAQLAPRAPA